MLSEYRKKKIGYEGEREADRHLAKTHFTGPYEILTNVELQISNNNHIQIDTLIMTTSQLLILEIKNIAGTLEFLDNPQRLRRTLDNGKVDIFTCPADQLEKNRLDMDVWLGKNGFPLKTSGAIILAYSKTNVKAPPLHEQIYYAKLLPQVLRKNESHPTLMNPKQLSLLANKIKRSQRPFNPFPLCTRFRIDPSELNPGMYCSHCHGLLIRKTVRTWTCSECRTNSSAPFAENIKDWFTLVQNQMTNKNCRTFLNLKDKYAAHHALNQTQLQKSGKNRNTKYHWPTPLH